MREEESNDGTGEVTDSVSGRISERNSGGVVGEFVQAVGERLDTANKGPYDERAGRTVGTLPPKQAPQTSESIGGAVDWGADWDDAPQTDAATAVQLPRNIRGAWLETKYNKEKTLGYRVMRWRDATAVGKSGKPVKRMLYIRRLGGVYRRTQMKARVSRDDYERELHHSGTNDDTRNAQ